MICLYLIHIKMGMNTVTSIMLFPLLYRIITVFYFNLQLYTTLIFCSIEIEINK